MSVSLSLDSLVTISPRQVSSSLDGEEVILNLANGTYYGLDPVGARIWSLLKEPCTVAQVCEAIVAEYDVTPERCQQDVLALLSDLVEAELVEVHGGRDASASPSDAR